MILVIDNYDSFTYNLVQYLGELGAELVVYRNDQISLEEIADVRQMKRGFPWFWFKILPGKSRF